MKHFHYRLVLIFFLLVAAFNLNAQLQFSSYLDGGENNVSDGFFLKTGVLSNYNLGKSNLYGGMQFDLKTRNENVLSGIFLKADYELSIRKFPFTVEGLFFYNLFSETVHESNWALSVKKESKHFKYQFGTHFRTYMLTQNANSEYNIEDEEKIHENWNLIYLLQYNLKPIENDWNIGISITNIDHFLITQETNPLFYVHGNYKISKPLSLYAEAWLKRSGMLNISVHSFGYLIRTGIIWNIDLSK